MWTEIRRKSFHLLSLIYVVGLIYMPRPRFLLALVALFTMVFAVEWTRLKIESVNALFMRRFGFLFREEERHSFTGVLWMLLGVITAVYLLPPVPLAATAILYLVLGDGVASLIGMRLQGPRWPDSRKRLSGSLACFLVCLLIGIVLLRPIYGWHGIVLGAIAATLLEKGFWRLNDNFVIPAGSALVFMACYGVRP